MRQRRWIELLSDYDCVIRYHQGKENVITDASSKNDKEPIRVRAMVVTVHDNLPEQIRNAQVEACKEDNNGAEGFLGEWEPLKLDPMEIVCRHGVAVSIISDLNPRFVSGFLEIPSKVIRDEFGYEHCLSSSTDGQGDRNDRDSGGCGYTRITNNRLRASSNTRNQAIIQGDRVNIQSRNSGNAGRNNRRAYVQEEIVEGSNAPNETGNVQRTLRTSSSGNTSTVQCYNCSGKGHYARNCPKPRVRDSKYFMEQMLLAKQDEAGVILTDEQNDFLFADASRMEEIEELSANICLMARIQPADNTSDAGPSYDSAFISEVQSSSNTENEEQMYPTHTKIINSTIGDDQIDSDIIFDSPNGNVNSGSIEKDTHVPDLCALEQLARNAYQEAEKQQIFAQKVQKQNTTLTSQLELYKERVRVLENINGDNNYLNEFLEADKRAKHFSQQAQSQFVRDRDIIRDLEKQRDKLDLDVKDYKRQNEELQKTHSILKRQMSENEDRYHDTVLDLEAKLKKNVDLILKLGNSLQGMFMLGPKPLSVYDQQLKHGLGYPNPYTLKQAISQCPKLYLASSLGNSEISLNVRDTEDTLDDASKSQQKVYEKMNDPIAVANKQNCWTIDYAQINALYKDFVPQKELSAEQKYFPSSFIPSDKNSNATPSIPASMPSESPLIIELDKIKNCFQRLSELIQKNCKRASIFYTSPEEIQLNDFCQDQLKPIVNELQFYFEFFNTLF
ncbi:retrovirus-related pol polyprotein from transposon TNT 1-94 [Tanacetum coccineum]